jgi:hypothetical protein
MFWNRKKSGQSKKNTPLPDNVIPMPLAGANPPERKKTSPQELRQQIQQYKWEIRYMRATGQKPKPEIKDAMHRMSKFIR